MEKSPEGRLCHHVIANLSISAGTAWAWLDGGKHQEDIMVTDPQSFLSYHSYGCQGGHGSHYSFSW
jgi:hypothetical protein